MLHQLKNTLLTILWVFHNCNCNSSIIQYNEKDNQLPNESV